MVSVSPAHQYWVKRLGVPAYQVVEAARFAGTTVGTISKWQKRVVAHREARRASRTFG